MTEYHAEQAGGDPSLEASNAEVTSLARVLFELPVLPGGFLQGGEAHAEIEAG